MKKLLFIALLGMCCLTSMSFTNETKEVETSTILVETTTGTVEMNTFDYFTARIASYQKVHAANELKIVELKLNPCGLPSNCTTLDYCSFDHFTICGGVYYAFYWCFPPMQTIPFSCARELFDVE